MMTISRRNISLLFCGIIVFSIGILLGDFYKGVNADEVSTNVILVEDETTLFPEETIPSVYETNFYVKMNNMMVQAINDYTDGKISEEEYLAICSEVDQQVNTEEGFEKLKESENEFEALFEE